MSKESYWEIEGCNGIIEVSDYSRSYDSSLCALNVRTNMRPDWKIPTRVILLQFVMGILFVIAIGSSQQSNIQPRFTFNSIDTVKFFRHPDTTEHFTIMEPHTRFLLVEIRGDNDWIEVRKDSLAGWIQTTDVISDLSFVEGYRLRLNLWSINVADFEQMTGYSVEYIEHTKNERLSKRYLYDGFYMKHIFTTVEDAKFVGDSLKGQQLLDEHPATGFYYLIVPIFKSEYPHLYQSVCGGNEPVSLLCPLCDQTLCDPNSAWVNRITGQRYEIHECINRHHIIVFIAYWD